MFWLIATNYLPDTTNSVYHHRLSIPQIFILYRQEIRICQSYWIYGHNLNSILLHSLRVVQVYHRNISDNIYMQFTYTNDKFLKPMVSHLCNYLFDIVRFQLYYFSCLSRFWKRRFLKQLFRSLSVQLLELFRYLLWIFAIFNPIHN